MASAPAPTDHEWTLKLYRTTHAWVVDPARYDQVIACVARNSEHGICSTPANGSTVDVTAPRERAWACALWLALQGRHALLTRYRKGQVASVFEEVLMTHVATHPNARLPRGGSRALLARLA